MEVMLRYRDGLLLSMEGLCDLDLSLTILLPIMLDVGLVELGGRDLQLFTFTSRLPRLVLL